MLNSKGKTSMLASSKYQHPAVFTANPLFLATLRVCAYSDMSNSRDPMDCTPPGSSVHGIFQASILEWVVLSYSRGSSRPGIEPAAPVPSHCQADWFLSFRLYLSLQAKPPKESHLHLLKTELRASSHHRARRQDTVAARQCYCQIGIHE